MPDWECLPTYEPVSELHQGEKQMEAAGERVGRVHHCSEQLEGEDLQPAGKDCLLSMEFLTLTQFRLTQHVFKKGTCFLFK